ncbi:hypothetical protein [Flavobacterium difficile]|uniref:Uncharacterized protein n=1 Tax=Flavobacterium difficile TaxID=2709659 RepID=A0ABX0I581_9FLAO|nr:hypothetical protein [Flavobacterium difficile]NHM01757.1 hypothetical protein [Flavobacterium difficile]
MKKNSYFIICFYVCLNGFSQNVGIGTITPNINAILDIYSENQGFLPTRSVLVQTILPNPLSQHSPAMITYNTFESQTYTPVSVHDGLYYNDGAQWNMAGPNAIMFGDIKHSLATTDHNGWYLLDGRSIALLPTTAQSNAISIGLSGNLINMDDSFIKTKTPTDNMGNITGSNQIVLTQAHLPNVNFSGITALAGNHHHEYSDQYSPIQSLGLATNVLALLPIINVNVGRPENLTATLFSSTSSGDHSHTVNVNSGGLDVPIEATPKHIVTNVFIYLGE